MFPFMERAGDYQAGKRDFAPWSVEIQPTAKCNHHCIHCSYEERNQSRASMSEKAVASTVDSIIQMGVKGVYFSGGGEPCIYPGLKEHMERLCDNGVEVALLTNGTLLEQAGIFEIAHKLNYIAVSVPSCDKDTFKKITGVDKVGTVIDIANRIKAVHGKQSPVIGARVIVTNLIAHEIESIFHTLRDNQYDYVLYKIVRDYEDRGLGVDEKTNEEIRGKIKEMTQAGLIDESFTNLGHVFDYRTPVEFSGKCFVNDMGMLANITPEGEVYPNIVEIVDSRFCVGNVNDLPLEKIWNSERHHAVKALSNQHWKKGACKNCRAITYNKIIEKALDSLPCDPDSFI